MSSTPSTPPGADGPPLTRRQRRALERAQEEAQRASTGQVPLQQQAQGPGRAQQPASQSASATWKPSATDMPAVRKPAAQARAQGRPAPQARSGATPASAVGAAPASAAGGAVAWKPVAPARPAAPPAAQPAPASRPVPEARPAPAARPTPVAQPVPVTAGPAAPSPVPASPEPAPRDRMPRGPGPQEEAQAPQEPQVPEPAAATGPQKAIGAALGRRPRGLLAIALAGVVVLVMVLGPLAVKNLGLPGEQGQASAQALETVLSGDDPLESVVEVAGRPGVVPVVSLKGALTPATSLHEDLLVEGTGRTVSQGDAVLLSISTFSGLDGRNTTGTETGASLRTVMLDDALGEELDKAIEGKTEGSRVVLRAPHEEDGELTTEITVIDILPTVATGEEREPTSGMPAVTIDKDGAAQISVQGLSAPTTSSITTLIQGQGPQVGRDDLLIARYSIVNWSTGQVSGTSAYGSTVLPRSIDMRNTLAGVSQLLVDVPVGSRVVLALPADQARGEDAVAVVIDVLAIASRDDAPATAPATEPAAPTATPTAPPTAAPTATPAALPEATAASGEERP
ncbi:hypothetical protein NSA19_03025 [Actinomyces bowdenii]|uniref:hypothetical protein n=1 Tax=Actinomyces bowdenii TaxID=131109 RepID=UPI00214B0D16|nr:hypothetical protein [Actinomyces bowdenii]MCR2051842.1 hypothetical protein [Actinomyces bowdenii]